MSRLKVRTTFKQSLARVMGPECDHAKAANISALANATVGKQDEASNSKLVQIYMTYEICLGQ